MAEARSPGLPHIGGIDPMATFALTAKTVAGQHTLVFPPITAEELGTPQRFEVWLDDPDRDGIPHPIDSLEDDLDNDGIVDGMDLDADGDGCPDALEAGPDPCATQMT